MTPPAAHPNARRFESPKLYPLPPACEVKRSPLYLAAMRWMVYGQEPLNERTADAAAARFGLDGGATGAHGFRMACAVDGIMDYQLMQAGWLAARDEVRQASGVAGNVTPPAGLMPPPISAPAPMGSPEKAEREREAREGQQALLEAERERMLAEIPAHSPGTSTHAKLMTGLKMVNGMLAEVTGLGLVMRAAGARASRLDEGKPAPLTRDEGTLIDVD